MNQPALLQARLYVVAAAVLWSLSGTFVKLLRPPEVSADGAAPVPGLVVLGFGDPHQLGLGAPPVPPLVMACFRGMSAGLVFVPFLRRRDLTFRPRMAAMMVTFAVMNALFVSAMGLGTAANAIVLQYTAPLWIYLAGILWLNEPTNRRNTIALAIAMTGVAVIVIGAWQGSSAADLLTVLIAIGSGITYAAVLLFIRSLRDVSPTWITVLNNFAAGLMLAPFLFLQELPTPRQVVCLLLFGSIQMALPYWFMARGLRVVSTQEAGTISLLEPLLNPVWAYLVAGDVPERWTFMGGALILAALTWRYWPGGRERLAQNTQSTRRSMEEVEPET
jgi:drug/metabolite transporter (DMT)-like permease